ncbi:MAG: SDR family oxidoreductase [Chitinophagaceae bacterium]|jgi:short-subunit dehydrogenase|nr:SDR family oxidoreductase [Chitinophagaceae bacterium]
METIKGKNILLVGGTGGIGSRLAKLLAGSGATVFITGRNREKLAEAGTLAGIGTERQLILDITDAKAITETVTRVQEYGGIDILINAAGIGIIKPMDKLSMEEFSQTIQVNLMGSFLLVKAVLPGMKEAGKGLVIHIPGVLGKVPMAGAAAYAASKYGLVGMMQSIREELKRTEIRITNLFLGGVDSPFWDGIDLRVQRDKMVVAEEAAKAIWFLCQQPPSGVVSEMVLQPFNHQAI